MSSQAGAQQPDAKKDEESKPETKFAFIEMLFALVVAEVALQAFTLVQAIQLSPPVPADKTRFDLWCDASCFVAHLVLSLAIIACSWIGWSHSKAVGNKEDAKDVF